MILRLSIIAAINVATIVFVAMLILDHARAVELVPSYVVILLSGHGLLRSRRLHA